MADVEPTLDRAAEQARIRKERREAKIRAGGSARLNKITGLGGGVQRDAPLQPQSGSVGDPEEVDISVSEHFYQPESTTARYRMQANRNAFDHNANIDTFGPQGPQMSDEQIRQMMLGFPPSSIPNNNNREQPNPFGGPPGMEGMEDDPVMQMMQQLMGGNIGSPDLGQMNLSQNTTTNPYSYIWRLIHAIFATSLGLYITLTTPFTGTKLEREQSLYADPTADLSQVGFFWIFATAEILLQTTRFWMEKGVMQHTGLLGTVVNFLPAPWKGHVAVMSRYARIWTTVSADAMVLVFVLGVCAWWRGQ